MLKKIGLLILSFLIPLAVYAANMPTNVGIVDPSNLNQIFNQQNLNMNNGLVYGVIGGSQTAVATGTGTSLQNLNTFTLPASYMTRVGQGLRVKCWGTTAANTNAKTVSVVFGANTLSMPSTIVSGVVWSIEGTMYKSGASTQNFYFNGVTGANSTAGVAAIQVTTGTNTDTSAITIACAGTDGTSSAGDISNSGMSVESVN